MEDVESALKRARRGAEALEARLEPETLPVAGQTTVVVHDGLITGLTPATACCWARMEGVARLIAATPVGHIDGLARLRKEADVVACPHPLRQIAVVGQAYDIFGPLDEWYIAGLLADAAAGTGGSLRVSLVAETPKSCAAEASCAWGSTPCLRCGPVTSLTPFAIGRLVRPP